MKKNNKIKSIIFFFERCEAEGRAESQELGWKIKKWIKKKVPPTDDQFCTPLFLSQIHHILKKILEKIG